MLFINMYIYCLIFLDIKTDRGLIKFLSFVNSEITCSKYEFVSYKKKKKKTALTNIINS